MSNASNERKILERLKLDCDTEMMRHELNEMLEAELRKPAEEVDQQVVSDLMNLLGEDRPSAWEQQACWNNIQKDLKKTDRYRWLRVVCNCAATAAAVVLVFLISFQSARAFNWTHLLKWLTPLAETFGIYSENGRDASTLISEIDYSDEEADFTQVTYRQLEEMPSHHKGFPIVLGWVPDGFGFVQGSLYEDPDMAKTSITYKAEDAYLMLTVSFLTQEIDVSSYEYEKNVPDMREESLNGKLVSFYTNMDNERLSASWLEENTHYLLNGDIEIDEMKQVIQSLKRGNDASLQAPSNNE